MKKSVFITLSLLLLLVTGCSRNKRNTINISGAFALYPLTVQWAEAYMEENPEIRINISAGGAGKGMADALAEMVDLGMFSREPAPEELQNGAWLITVACDAVIPTINNAFAGDSEYLHTAVTRNQFIELFLNEETRSKEDVHIYTRSDACGAAATWARYLGATQEELQGTAVFGDPGLADAVKNDPKGIGFNNMVYIYDITTRQCYPGIKPLPIDLNENGTLDEEENFYSSIDEVMEAVKNGVYPSPPARNLYLVAHGKPTKEITIDFLKWIMTTGQSYVNKAGYVMLSENQRKQQFEKL